MTKHAGRWQPLGMRAIPCAILVACACAPDERAPRVETTSQAITNGASDDSDPAVVGIVDGTGMLVCTGTLVAPGVVLTAAHCLEGATTDVTGGVFFGSTLGDGGTVVPLTGALVHPDFDPTSLANDLALLALATPSSATPAPLLAPTPDASLANATVRIVGFGDTAGDASDFGRKRTGTSTVASVTATTMELAGAPSQQCFGDSGGAALLNVGGTEYLAGVTSHGDTACVASSYDTRVDAYAAAFIEPFLAACAAGGCPTACDPVGTPCASGLQCENVDGGIDFACTPVPSAPAANSHSSCSSAPDLTNGGSPWSVSLVIAIGMGLSAARRRARVPGRDTVRS